MSDNKGGQELTRKWQAGIELYSESDTLNHRIKIEPYTN